MEAITQLAESRADELRALEAQTEQNPGEVPVPMTEVETVVAQPTQSGAAEETVEEDPVTKPKKRKISLALQKELRKIKNKEDAFVYTYADTENEALVDERDEKMSRYANIGTPAQTGTPEDFSGRNEFWVEMYKYDDTIYLDIYLGYASQSLYRNPRPSPPPPPTEREVGELRILGNGYGRLIGTISDTDPVFTYNRVEPDSFLTKTNDYKVFLPQSEGGFEINKKYIKRKFPEEVKVVRQLRKEYVREWRRENL